ncbi:hypothetical protein F511_24476 [Dorcoceras hygrometricum]|uniref:Uncharacterized protein n=1 Tax=Dorcoceras hygrometricum TaxID=472368 RepID=A0A2Z7CU66_9LAMI|nr:hypothetical protein F511_24476 [Dorcoceras hygrometricum]
MAGTSPARERRRVADGGGAWPTAAAREKWRGREGGEVEWGGRIQLAMGPKPLRLRNHNFGLAQRIMVKRLATSRHDPLGITDSACKNQLVVVSVQYDPFNTYIPIRSTTIGKSRVARDPIAMHTSWRSNSDITSVTRASMTFRVVRTNQYNQDLGLIHSTNGNHLESPNEGSSIDHQVTIHLHAQNITMFPTNETCSSSGGTKVDYCDQCGGKHPTAQCVGVQGSCNICGQYGHFAECVLCLDRSIPQFHHRVEVDRLELLVGQSAFSQSTQLLESHLSFWEVNSASGKSNQLLVGQLSFWSVNSASAQSADNYAVNSAVKLSFCSVSRQLNRQLSSQLSGQLIFDQRKFQILVTRIQIFGREIH